MTQLIHFMLIVFVITFNAILGFQQVDKIKNEIIEQCSPQKEQQ